MKLASPGGEARLEARPPPWPAPPTGAWRGPRRRWRAGAASLTGVRRHATTFAGRKAVVQEADQGGWHGWAWATCDRGEQYRVFLSGRAPVSRETSRCSAGSWPTARLGGTP